MSNKAASQLFDLRAPSSTDVPVLLVNQPIHDNQLQYSSQILKHLSDFPLPNVDLGLQSSQCSKIRVAQHWGRRGAHLSENKGVISECKKFGENSRQNLRRVL